MPTQFSKNVETSCVHYLETKQDETKKYTTMFD